MQVVGDDFRLDAHQLLPRGNFAGEVIVRLVVFQIANVLREKRVPVASKAERVFQFPTNCQNMRRRCRKSDRIRNETACAPEELPLTVDEAHHRIIAFVDNGPIMHKRGVSNQAFTRTSSREASAILLRR